MNARRLTLAVLVSVSVPACVLALGAGAATASADSCPNAQFRTGYSAHLPDCRAYELVTPPGSPAPIAPLYLTSLIPGFSLPEGNAQAQAAVDGGRMAYGSEESNSQSPGLIYLATRGPQGWSSENVIPPQSVENTICLFTDVIAGWSPDLSKGVLTDGYDLSKFGTPIDCGRDEPELVPGEPHGVGNLFVRDGHDGSYQLVDVTPATVTPAEASFDAGSADLSHIVFNENAKLTVNAPSGNELYEWSAGKVYLVTILPGGTATATQGQLAGTVVNEQSERPWQTGGFSHAVSANGSRTFFEANGNLYLRENGAQEPIGECGEPARACTVQVDVAQQGGSGSSGGGTFKWASTDGSKVFFIDESKLTADSTAEAGKPDLYEYDLEATAGHHLTDLTVNAGEPANVQGVSGASEDGSYVYFVADGVLPGAGENSRRATAQAGKPNLYLLHAGATRFIAMLDPASTDVCDWTAVCLTARISSNGEFIAFDSTQSLTGYDNSPAQPADCEYTLGTPYRPGVPCIEIFRYAATAGELACASCDPSGARPTASATIRTPALPYFFHARGEYPARNVSDSGQVFFDTAAAPLPAASNGKSNAYEYENGQLHLISSGTSSEASYFFDATSDGSDAFFITEQPLLPQDTRAGYAIYDARVGGGFPYTPPAAPCSGEACKGALTSAPLPAAPASVSFSGPGNSQPTAVKSHRAARLSRAQRLRRSLRACRKKPKRKRALCEKRARKANLRSGGSK
jgi:hypothetical protein